MNTPESIDKLESNEIFVFGSNKYGFHDGGAAAVAAREFGAIHGQGEGLQGQSYAIPTMGTLAELREAVGRFIEFASTRSDLTFLVTKIGTGIAGYSICEVAPLFREIPENVIIPREFEND